MSIFGLSVKNPVLVNMVMLGIIVLGTYSYLTLPREEMPDIDFNWVFIVTTYPGASAEEVEKLVTIPIEEEIQDVDKIDHIASTSSENNSMISVKFEMMDPDDFDKRLNDLRAELDKVTDLPDDSEDPIVFQLKTSTWLPMLSVVLYGDVPERVLKETAEELQEEIKDIGDISKVTLAGVRDREIWVEVDPSRLEAYRLSIQDVVDAVRVSNLDMPGGTIATGRAEYMVRALGEAGGARELEKIVVRRTPGGRGIRIGDVAAVSDTLAEAETISRLNGRKAVALMVQKKTEGNTIRLTDEIRELVADYSPRLPAGVHVEYTNDSSTRIRNSLQKLESNALIGMLFVIIILYVFIGFRNAVLAGIGIPISFMATFLFMKWYGESLSGNSLFGLVLVLGIIVDDAIVILENSYRYMQKGLPPAQAVLKGAPEVAVPVLSSILTTIAAFLPLMLMPGIIGEFMKIIPIVVSFALIASLVEAFFILPSHIADWGKVEDPDSRGDRFFDAVRSFYRRALVRILRRRYTAVGTVLFIAVLLGGIIPLIGVDMFADEEVSQFYVRVRLPVGTRLEETDRVLSVIEEKAQTLPEEEVVSVTSVAGILNTDTETVMNTHVGEVTVDLVEERERERTSDRIMADLRDRIGDLAGLGYLKFARVPTGPPITKPIEVKAKGKYLDELEEVADLVKKELASIHGVIDINDDFSRGKKEMRVEVDGQRAAVYGLTKLDISMALRTAFEGSEVTSIMDGDEEVDIIVKFREDRANRLETLETMRVGGRGGVLVPLGNVVSISWDRGIAEIKRFDLERAITVTAEVDNQVTDVSAVTKTLEEHFAGIESIYPGYSLAFEGEFEEFKEIFSDVGHLFLIGIAIILIILGSQFGSWIQPFIILFTIPFAFIGAMLGLLIGGNPFSIVTLYGMVALAGVALNDSIVFIDFINRGRRERGLGVCRSIVTAGSTRLRPIMLTSLTTISGLLPMMIGLGGKSVVWQPLANTIVWGLLMATFLTLFIIPCLYAITVDLKNFARKMRRRLRGGRVPGRPETGTARPRTPQRAASP